MNDQNSQIFQPNFISANNQEGGTATVLVHESAHQHMQKLERSGGMLPQDIFFKVSYSDKTSEGIFGHKTSLQVFALVLAR